MKDVLPVSRGPKIATLVLPFKIIATSRANGSMPTILAGSSSGLVQMKGFTGMYRQTIPRCMDVRYKVADAQRIDDVLQGQSGGVSAVDRLDHFDPHAREARRTAE